MGEYPNNEKWQMVMHGEMMQEEFSSHPEYMEPQEEADIYVIMNAESYKHFFYVQSDAFKTKKSKVLEKIKDI